MACTPECLGDQLRIGRRFARHGGLDTIDQSEHGRFPNVRAGAPLHETASGMPIAECRRIGHRRSSSDDGADGLDVGARIQQRVEDGHVVATGRPVQRRLAGPADPPGVDIRAGTNQQAHDHRSVREVAGPVGRDVEEGPPRPGAIGWRFTGRVRLVDNASHDQLGVLRQQRADTRNVSGPNGRNDSYGTLIGCRDQKTFIHGRLSFLVLGSWPARRPLRPT